MNYEVKNIYGKIANKKACVCVVGSKSITARALLLAALADGVSHLYGAQFSDDCTTFLTALQTLGIKAETDGTTVKIHGCGGVIPVKSATVNVGSAGTAARFLTALLAFRDGEFILQSSEQMKRRPQKPLIVALQQAGAEFEFLEEEYCFPFKIFGTRKTADKICVNVEKSSQYLSALLMCAVCAGKPVTVTAEGAHGMDYVNMTLDMMWSFGVSAEEKDGSYTVCGNYTAKKYDIEPDVSAACYFYAINRILGTEISVRGVMPHTSQGDYKFIELIKNFDGGTVDMSAFSDQALTLAAIAPYFSKPTTVTGIAHVRGQECDRIKAACENLSAMGVKVEEREDGFTVYPCKPHGAVIDAFGDHRVAMSFALTGLRTDGVIIRDAEVCSKTFKGYFETLDKLIDDLT